MPAACSGGSGLLTPPVPDVNEKRVPQRVTAAIRRALSQFLAVPIVIVGGFLLLAAGTYLLDRAWWTPGKQPQELAWLDDLFGDTGALSSLLGTVATSLITVTSITFSLLLLAVQQGAAALTNQVFDQFMRRRANQAYFGFFVGLSVFALITLVTVSQVHRPVFGALAAVLLTTVALCLVVVLIYTTIDQMRPASIIRAIRGHTLRAREAQRPLLERTRRSASPGLQVVRRIQSEQEGFVTEFDFGCVARAVAEGSGAAAGDRLEVELRIEVGSYVAYGDVLADLRCGGSGLDEARAGRLAAAVVAAVRLEEERDLDRDPGSGITQIETIGWTSVSTARSNPAPGLLACQCLRDILARWSSEDPCLGDPSSAVVYPDRVPARPIAALESLSVAASESMQHQMLAEIVRTLAVLLGRLPRPLADQAEDVILRSLSALGEHVLTRELQAALGELAASLAATGRAATAGAVQRAERLHAKSIGVLNSRSTRVPPESSGS